MHGVAALFRGPGPRLETILVSHIQCKLSGPSPGRRPTRNIETTTSLSALSVPPASREQRKSESQNESDHRPPDGHRARAARRPVLALGLLLPSPTTLNDTTVTSKLTRRACQAAYHDTSRTLVKGRSDHTRCSRDTCSRLTATLTLDNTQTETWPR